MRRRRWGTACSVGEDDDGYKVKCRLQAYMQYLRKNTDDSPLHIQQPSDSTRFRQVLLTSSGCLPTPGGPVQPGGGEEEAAPQVVSAGPAAVVHLCAHRSARHICVELQCWRAEEGAVPSKYASLDRQGLDLAKAGEDDEAANHFSDPLPRIISLMGTGSP
jgi:hypothetical protein